MAYDAVKDSLLRYVERNSGLYGVEWDPHLSEPLPFNPFDPSQPARKLTAHFFLLVASINETDLIGRAENARAVLTYFYRIFHEDLFRLVADDAFRQYLPQLPCSHELGPHKTAIPSILASANRFLQHTAHGDLIAYVTGLTRLQDVVDVLTGQIDRMSADKAWMYLRWMSRPAPDLGVFDAFSPADLQVPLTSYIRDVAYCLGLCADPRTTWWTDEEEARRARVRFTDFAKTLYPDDPCRVDYPLYLLGRWIRGKRLSRDLLARYLAFFEAVYRQTGTVPVTYDIVSRDMSAFESQLRAELQKMEILFSYESHKFTLRKGVTYRPDFVLPTCTMQGRTVLLEPHGVWTRPIPRRVYLRRHAFTVHALPLHIDPAEKQFTDKLRTFRAMYGKDYYVILLVPNQAYDRVQRSYPQAYDAIYMSTDIPDLLYQLKAQSMQ